MPRYDDYSTDGAPPGGVFLHTDEGEKHAFPKDNADVYMQMARIDRDKAAAAKDEEKAQRDEAKLGPPVADQRLASNDDAGRVGAAMFGDPSQRPAPAPSMSDAAPTLAPPAGPADPRATMARAAAVQERVNGGPLPPAAAPAPPNAASYGGVATGAGGPGGAAPGAAPAIDPRGAQAEQFLNEYLNQKPTAGRMVKGGTFETGSQITTGGKVDPKAIDAEKNAFISGAMEKTAQAEAEAGLVGDIERRQAAATSVIGGEYETRKAEREAQMRAVHDEQVKLAKDIGAADIDQDHYWSSRATGQKIAWGIAAIFGTLGAAKTAAATRQAAPNVVLDMLQKNIDRDIEAQKQNIGNKKVKLSGLGEAYQRYRAEGLDDERATEATRAAALQRIAAHATALANASGQPLADARAQAFAAEAEQRSADIDFKTAADQAARSQTTRHLTTTQDRMVGGGPSALQKLHELQNFRKTNAEIGGTEAHTASEQAKAGQSTGAGGEVVGPDGTAYSIAHLPPEQQGKIRDYAASRGELVALTDQLQVLYAKNGTHALSPSDAARADRLKSDLLAANSVAHGQGALGDQEYERNAKSITGFGGGAGLDEMKTSIANTTAAHFRAYGVKPK